MISDKDLFYIKISVSIVIIIHYVILLASNDMSLLFKISLVVVPTLFLVDIWARDELLGLNKKIDEPTEAPKDRTLNNQL